MVSCVLCEASRGAIASNGSAVAVWDAHPVAEGHLLVLSRRHVGRLEALTRSEQQDLWSLVHELVAEPPLVRRPDGWTVGVNDGPAAGQVVDHVHVHLIPRYFGDVTDPRGGVRWVLGKRARWW